MKTKSTPSKCTQALLTRSLLPVVALGSLVSCGSPNYSIGTKESHRSASSPGGGSSARLDAVPRGKNRDRIKRAKLVSVNGAPAKGRSAKVPVGSNSVAISLSLPQGGSMAVPLKFYARANQDYFVRFDPFPPTASQFSGTTDAMVAAGSFLQASASLQEMPHPVAHLAGAVVLAPGILLAAGDRLYRVGETIREYHSAIKYVDVMVISRNPAEGVVRRVRAFPDGRLLSEKYWDNYRYTPGGEHRFVDEPIDLDTAREGLISYTGR